MTLLCPRCRTQLEKRAAHELIIHGCTRCGGVWLDLGGVARLNVALSAPTLRALDALAQEASRVEGVARPIDCPCCAEILIRTPVAKAGVSIDRCPDHGAWYDRDELQQVARALGTTPAPAPASQPKPPKPQNKKAAAKPQAVAPPPAATPRPQGTAPKPPAAMPYSYRPLAPAKSDPNTLIGAAEELIEVALNFLFKK